MKIRFFRNVAIAWLAAATVQAHAAGLAPASTTGLDIVLTIEHTESTLPGGFPTMGAVRQTYAADGTYTYAGFGGPNHLIGTGTYKYTKTGRDTATEDALQSSDFFTLPYHMEYTFVTREAGRWRQFFAGGLIVFEGSFATSPRNSREQRAPETLADVTLLLTTIEAPDTLAEVTLLVTKTDASGRLALTTISHDETTFHARQLRTRWRDSGIYVARKMAARSLVEETTGAGGLTVRSFTFTSRLGGYWKATQAADGATSEGRFVLLR